MRMKAISLMYFIVFVATLTGCGGSAGSHVMLGEVRSSINPADVKIYTSLPKQYEEIAIISATSMNAFTATDQDRMNVVIERLKKEAAALGANGILLTGASGFSTFSRGNTLHKAASGVAMYNQAIKDYSKAIEINPRHAEVYYNRGFVYAKKGQHNQAIEDFTKAIEINSRYAEAYYNRGFTYLVKLGDKNRGCADWKLACELGACQNYNLAKRNGDCR